MVSDVSLSLCHARATLAAKCMYPRMVSGLQPIPLAVITDAPIPRRAPKIADVKSARFQPNHEQRATL